MDKLHIIKGIHPGFIVERELKKRNLGKGQFAISLGEFPQTFSAVTKGKRNMNPALALKIEKALGFEEGFLMVLQAYYEIEREKDRQDTDHPDLNIIRPVVFWDTDIKKIKWKRYKKAVIKRIFERGN